VLNWNEQPVVRGPFWNSSSEESYIVEYVLTWNNFQG